MDIYQQFQKDFNAQFSDMRPEAKAYTQRELDHDQGMKDAENGVEYTNKGVAYTEGYFFQKAYQVSVEAGNE